MLEQVQARLGYRFRDPALLRRALTHASARTEHGTAKGPCNERLEFLGDSVLGLVVAEHLFRDRLDAAEGALTRLRAHCVSAPALAEWGERLGLRDALALGKGLDRVRLPASVLADAVEAVLGAVYLDGGMVPVERLVLSGLTQRLAARSAPDWKSQLQEWTQQTSEGTLPQYELVSAEGPDHAKRFVVRVLVEGVERGRGDGRSKKAAEQRAARRAWEALAETDEASDVGATDLT